MRAHIRVGNHSRILPALHFVLSKSHPLPSNPTVAREYLQQFVWRLLSSSAVFVAPLALRRLLAEVRGASLSAQGAVTHSIYTPESPQIPRQHLSQVGTYLSQREAAGGEAPPIPTTMWLCVLGLFLGASLLRTYLPPPSMHALNT